MSILCWSNLSLSDIDQFQSFSSTIKFILQLSHSPAKFRLLEIRIDLINFLKTLKSIIKKLIINCYNTKPEISLLKILVKLYFILAVLHSPFAELFRSFQMNCSFLRTCIRNLLEFFFTRFIFSSLSSAHVYFFLLLNIFLQVQFF